jgi:hypothetical protein
LKRGGLLAAKADDATPLPTSRMGNLNAPFFSAKSRYDDDYQRHDLGLQRHSPPIIRVVWKISGSREMSNLDAIQPERGARLPLC